jgi:hypothetical protein
MTTEKKKTPWILWPFVAIWNLVAAIITLTGRFIAVLLGLVLIILGVVLSLTIIGAIIGVPMILFGVLLIVRGLW